MTVKTGQTWAGAFVTLDATGALEAGTPSGVLYIDGTADAATVTITGSNPYKWAVTLPTLTAGQRVDMYITGTIATIATAGFVASEQADTVRLSDGVTLASSQPAITWGQQKIVANVEYEGALEIRNSHSQGIGLLNSGNMAQLNEGQSVGVLNEGGVIGFDSAIATASNLQTVDDNVDAIKAKTDNLPADPAAVGSAMTLTAAYDKAKDDVLTPLAVVDGIVDAIKVQTDKIPATPASAGEYTTNIGEIKAKTDNLPLSPASSGEYTSALTDIQSDLDNPDQYKADVSTLATTAHVQEVENKVDLIDVTTVANSGKIDAVDTKVSAIDTDTVMSFMIDGFTFEQIVQIMAAVLAGKLTRSGDTLTFKDLADTVNRVVAETDANKQRTTMTYTV